jgi:purine-binding chemotaxis protein CheW
MSTTNHHAAANSGALQFASFQVGDLLLGIDIRQVQEINRNLQITPVPHAPAAVCGVINLRGEVVTVVDLRTVLGLEKLEFSRSTRNVIIKHGGEQIGLLVDSVAEVVTCQADDTDSLPENLSGRESVCFSGVYKLPQGLLVLLNVAETLAALGETTAA